MNTRVSYQQLFPLTAFLNERIGLEMDVPDGTDPLQVLAQLKQMAQDFYKSSNSHITNSESNEKQVVDEPVNQRIATLIQDLNQCTVIDEINGFGAQIGLVAFHDAAQSNPEIKSAYDLKMKQLGG